MTDLDAAGARANNPGLTPAAKKAAAKAKGKAWWAAFWGGIRGGIAATWNFIVRNLLLWIAIAIVAAASTFDWWMSARGWLDYLPGLGVFAFCGAAASVGFWYIGVRRAREEWREPKATRSIPEIVTWTAIAISAFIICLTGLLIATATNSIEAQRAAKASRAEYHALVADRDAMQRKVDLYPVEYWDQAIKQDERALEAQLAIAKGSFGMPDLDIGKTCGSKLSFNQRRLCAIVNGGVDEFTGATVLGLRAEIEQSQNGRRQAVKDEAALQVLITQVRKFTVKTGDATAEAMAAMFDDAFKGETVMGWIFVLVMALFMFCGGFLGDWVMERITVPRRSSATVSVLTARGKA